MTVNAFIAATLITLSMVTFKLFGVALQLPPNVAGADLLAEMRSLAESDGVGHHANTVVAENNAIEQLPAPLLDAPLRISAR